MKTYNIIQLGLGNIGSELIAQIAENKENLKQRFNVELNYYSIFNSKGGLVKTSGFSHEELTTIAQTKHFETIEGGQHVSNAYDYLQFRPEEFFKNVIIVDTTTSNKLFDLHALVLQNGGKVAMANKKLLTNNLQEYKQLTSYGPLQLLHETTVGAGLPVIKTLNALLATGDEVIEIQGCFSGTLGYLCSALEDRKAFSAAVKDAKNLGYTEPDPRDDLSGMDVARKALILARMIGQEIELDDIHVEALFPSHMKTYSVDEFIDNIDELDEEYKEKFRAAIREHKTYRYIAKITKKDCTVGLQEVEMSSALGSLKGTENIIVIRTKRYDEKPLVIQGPGAGREVTAAGVFGDVLTAVGVL